MRLMNYNVGIRSSVGIDINVPIWQTEIDLPDISDLKEYIQNKKSDISGYYKQNISWDSYNVFSLEIESMKQLKNVISDTFELVKKDLNINDKNVRINGWINLLESGDHIPIHFHAVHENSFLTGTVNISDHITTTTFVLPIISEEIEISSFPGTITIFPQWLFHYVKPTDKDRYTLAFDLFNQESWTYYNFNNAGSNFPISRSISL